ncbi:hypothetical protein ATANTOWER_020404 [Ataeniobius toweri]|uniref:SET domain-containing protein n=1 Tax=Ataeniobius toweri TaxID=208326 RepID=A0ABU7CCH6_9TELE|nr:hypothetical protein [Ataeniobius toweri]
MSESAILKLSFPSLKDPSPFDPFCPMTLLTARLLTALQLGSVWRSRQMQTTMRPKREKLKPKDEAAYFVSSSKDKDGFDVQYINSFKGRGVFSTCHFQRGAFLLEYRGDVINKQEYERRLKIYHDALKVFMFEFRHNGKQLCVDAAREDGSLGRLVNDDHLNPNSRMKTITVNGQPHLCLFAVKDITPGEEITYNYGNSEWPWRVKVSAHTDQPETEEPMASLSSSLEPQKCKHVVLHSSMSSIEKCAHCLGPYAARKWSGLKCKDKLDLTDSDSEESEAAICDPSPCTKNQEPDEFSEDSIDGSGEGTSQGTSIIL